MSWMFKMIYDSLSLSLSRTDLTSIWYMIWLDYIFDNDPVTNRYVSAPGGQNCASFIAGIIQGILDSAEFVKTLIFPPILFTFSCFSYILLYLSYNDQLQNKLQSPIIYSVFFISCIYLICYMCVFYVICDSALWSGLSFHWERKSPLNYLCNHVW